MKNSNLPQHDRLAGALLAIFLVSFLGVLAYAYSQTEIQVRLENLLYDLRLRMIPQLTTHNDVVVVVVGDETIKKMDGDKAEKFSVASMTRVIDSALASNAKAVGAILPHQDFDYDSDEMWPLVRSVKEHPNLYLGVFDLVNAAQIESRLPLLVEYAGPSIYGTDTFREFWRAVVRQSVLTSYLGDQERNHLVTQLALDHSEPEGRQAIINLVDSKRQESALHARDADVEDEDGGLPPNFRINYRLPHTFVTVEAADLADRGSDRRLKDKIVLIGYTSLRIREGVFNEGTYVNSPWQSETNKISTDSGLPLVYVHASALENLLHGAWFRTAPLWINLLQTMILVVGTYLVWKNSKTAAVVYHLAFLLVLTAIQCVVMATANTIIPLGDSLFASLIASVAGAFFHGQKEAQLRVLQEAKAKSRRELSQMQARFLDRFAGGLLRLNQGIQEKLGAVSVKLSEDPTTVRAFHLAKESSTELGEYLEGMRQLASVDSHRFDRVVMQAVPFGEVVARLQSQFVAKLSEKKMALDIQGNRQVVLWSDRWLLESILFNLISNGIKYSSPGTTVILRIEPLGKHKVRLSVVDHGPGISPDFQDKIFEKFYRIKDDNVYKIKGSGLGLYLSRFFAQKLGTDITLVSQLDQGSNFSIVATCHQNTRWWQR